MAITWSDTEQKKISVINVGKQTYNLKDAAARTEIEELTTTIENLNRAVLHFIGTTDTVISDGDKTNRIQIGGQPYDAKNGDVVIYKPNESGLIANTEREYVWVGTDATPSTPSVGKWQEFGSTGALKAFAFADQGEVSVPSAGTVALSTESTAPATADDASFKPTITQKTGKDLQLTAAKDGNNKDVRGITAAGSGATLKDSDDNDIDTVISGATYTEESETLSFSSATFTPGVAPTMASSVELATTTVKQQAEYENATTVLRATYTAGADATLTVKPKATSTPTP